MEFAGYFRTAFAEARTRRAGRAWRAALALTAAVLMPCPALTPRAHAVS